MPTSLRTKSQALRDAPEPPAPRDTGSKEYLRAAPNMDPQGALAYARSLHSMVNTAAEMKE